MKQADMIPGRMAIAGFLSLLLSMAAAAPGFAESQWISLDGSEPGTEAELAVETDMSSPQRTVMTLKIHGFFVEQKTGPGEEPFYRVRVPGMGSLNKEGAPDLPVFRGRLGLLTGAERAVLQGAEPISDSFFDIWTEFSYWPQVKEATEPIEGNVPERFVIDEEIYGGEGYWPGIPGAGGQEPSSMHGLPTSDFTLMPVQWDPATGMLHVVDVVQYYFEHPGDPVQIGPFTRDTYQLLSGLIFNIDVIDDLLILGWWHYDADYLIVTPEDYHDTLDEFIDLKRSQGYFVRVIYVEDVGSDCDLIRDAIEDWYDDAPTSRDKYCLLVGDVNAIPTCTSPYLNSDYPSGVATDDLYGSVNGDDLDEEVYVGRLSVDNETDLGQQLDRIIAYQTGLHMFSNYNRAALVAHKEDAPGKYTEAHESVRTAYYSDPPAFETYYGYLGATDADVNYGINNDGFGVVAYRGHGSSSAWTGWNTLGEYYNDSDISGLTNNMHPVVWSFACSNSKLSVGDCVAEEWMEKDDYGAVSHYSATVASYTSQNHDLDRQMFQAVYDEGLVIQAQAIEFGEEMMGILNNDTNAWMYLLLGDPSMRIRTHGATEWTWILPEYIPFDPEIVYELPLQIDGVEGPVPDVLFSVWKPVGTREEGDEVFDNTYTDAGGEAVLGIQPQSEGWLYFALRGPDGEAVYDSVEVIADPTDVPDLEGGRLRFWAEPSVTDGPSQLRLSRALERAAEVEIYEVSGRRVRRLELGGQESSAAWDGRDDAGRRLPAGVYFARLFHDGRRYTTRLVLLR